MFGFNLGFRVCKQVETVGLIYMAASGAPERTDLHAQQVADVALSMTEKIKELRTPSGAKIEIRIG